VLSKPTHSRDPARPSVPKAPAGVCLAEPSPSDTPPPNLWHLWPGLSEVALAGGQIVSSSHLTAILRHFQIPSPPASNLCQSAPKANDCTDGCGSAESWLLLTPTVPRSNQHTIQQSQSNPCCKRTTGSNDPMQQFHLSQCPTQ